MSEQKKAKQVVVKLKRVRLSYPSLFVPTSMDDNSEKAYSAHFLIPASDPQVKAVQNAMLEVSKALWGANGETVFKELWKAGRVCMRKGETKQSADGNVMEGYAGHYFLSARGKTRPTVVDRDRSPLQEGDGKPYAGCFVNAIIAIWPQTGQYGKRINAQLQGVQFVEDGEAFGGGRAARPDEFDELADEFSGASAADDDDLTL